MYDPGVMLRSSTPRRVASTRRLADYGPWQYSTPSASPSCSRHFSGWPASCRVSLRFGAPLLLVCLLVGMLAGESGPGGIKFDDVRTTYLVGAVALALILFDGGLRTRLATFRSALAPSLVLATIGVLLTAALTAPV